MADIKGNQCEDTGLCSSPLGPGSHESMDRVLVGSEHKLGSQRDSDFMVTPVPLVGRSSQATCPGIFIDLCLWQGSGDM